MKILHVEDSIDTGYLVKVSLRPYEVYQVYSITEAKDLLAKTEFDLILIDVILPDGDGYKLCYELSMDPRLKLIPKLILSGKVETEDKIFGLNCGANDYITKPFAPGELKARVDANLRKCKDEHLFVEGIFEFDCNFQKCSVLKDGNRLDLHLTPSEFKIFLTLVKNKGKSLSREEIIKNIWTANGLNIESRGVDTHITHLRKKLGCHGNLIISIYGKGYAFHTIDQANAA